MMRDPFASVVGHAMQLGGEVPPDSPDQLDGWLMNVYREEVLSGRTNQPTLVEEHRGAAVSSIAHLSKAAPVPYVPSNNGINRFYPQGWPPPALTQSAHQTSAT